MSSSLPKVVTDIVVQWCFLYLKRTQSSFSYCFRLNKYMVFYTHLTAWVVSCSTCPSPSHWSTQLPTHFFHQLPNSRSHVHSSITHANLRPNLLLPFVSSRRRSILQEKLSIARGFDNFLVRLNVFQRVTQTRSKLPVVFVFLPCLLSTPSTSSLMLGLISIYRSNNFYIRC